VTFTVFPKLPKELQAMIWKRALPGPRVIQIDTDDVEEYVTRSRNVSVSWWYIVKAITQVPAILHTTAESRKIALQPYKLCFGEHLDGKQVNFDQKCDIMYITNSEATGSFFQTKCQFKVVADGIGSEDIRTMVIGGVRDLNGDREFNEALPASKFTGSLSFWGKWTHLPGSDDNA
jgi:hypothetical protein